MKKNVASQKVGAQLISATDGSAFTGSVTVSVTGDAGTQATGSVGSGACTHEGNGYHTYAPSQAETNYDLIAFTFTGTGAIPVTVQVFTRPTTGLLAPTVADRTLDVSVGGEAGVDWANVGSPTTTLALTGTTIATTQKVDIETIKTNPVVNAGTVTFPTTATLASTTNITAGTVTTATNVTTVNGLASGVITATSIAADAITAAKIADGAIDRAAFAADTGMQSIRSNTAQAGASTTITLDASASATTDFYKYDYVYLTGGTGVGQYRLITAYNGSTKVATVTPAWATNPASDSTFAVVPRGIADLEAILAVAVSTSTAQLGVNVVNFGGSAGTFASGRPEVNTSHFGGTAGTFASGRPEVNMTHIRGTASAGAVGYVGVDWGNVTAQSTSVNLSATTINLANTATTLTNLPAITANWLTATGIAADAITAAKIQDGAIDRATFAADTGLQSIRSGTAQAGAAGTITLDASASSTTDFYRGCLIYLTGGTGAGQVEACFSYDGTTKIATMWKNWKTTPDNTTTFAVQPSYASGVSTSLYAASDLLSISGTAGSNISGLSSLGTAYGAGTLTTNITGTLSTVTTLTNLPAITSNWLTSTGLATSAVDEIVDAVWDEVQSGHTTAGTFGKYLDAQVSTVGGGTAASIADAVWDEVLSGHLTSGTTGAALNAAGSAGDPWTTTLPGSYTGSQAGFKFGTLFATALNILHPYVGQDSSLELVIGDDYYAADNRNIQFTYGASPSLSGATVYLDIQTDTGEAFDTDNATSTAGSASGTVTQLVTFDLPGTTTTGFDEGWRAYRVRAVLSGGHTVTLTRGRLNMLSRGSDAPT